MGNEFLNCRCCGGVLDTFSNLTVCEHCGATNFISDVANKKIFQLNRANKLRQESEFDNAARIYDNILEENEPTADILWYRTLCEYGIEYVPDPISDKYFPTLHRINDESILDCSFFKNCIELCEGEQKETLLKEAKYIDEVQTKYLNIAANEDPYDVFICYKETDLDTGEETEDVHLCEELYKKLKMMGYKIFFARETLEQKLSIEYEPYIFAALKSAKVMVVLGTKAEYFSSVWVKNEWGRFLKLMAKNPDKQIFFACDDPEELPRAFAYKQAQILGEAGAINNLAGNIDEYLKGSPPKTKVITNQEKFDQAISAKSLEYADRLDKTQFGDREKHLRQDIWQEYGKAELTNKIYEYLFHIGAICFILCQMSYIIFSAVGLFGLDYFYKSRTGMSEFYVISITGAISFFLLGLIFQFSSKQICSTIKEEQSIVLLIVTFVIGSAFSSFILCIFLGDAYDIFSAAIMMAIPVAMILAATVMPFVNSDENAIIISNTHLRKLKELEDVAKNEFFEFADANLNELKQSGYVNDEAEVKDYHFDLVKTAVSQKIEEDKKYVWKTINYNSSDHSPVSKRIVFTILYCLLTGVLSIINIVILFGSPLSDAVASL